MFLAASEVCSVTAAIYSMRLGFKIDKTKRFDMYELKIIINFKSVQTSYPPVLFHIMQ